MQEWLDHNDILIYSAQNKGESVVAKRLIRTLKCKIQKKLMANDKKILSLLFE